MTMNCIRVHIVILLYGFSDTLGFIHLRIQHEFLSRRFDSYSESDFVKLYFDQPVDHFNPNDQRTWKQKYYKKIDSWKPRGPILIYINGEAALNLPSHSITNVSHQSGSGLVKQIVEEMGAALFMLEHRYYGDTKPFDDPTTENMAFLSSKQALADAALFVQTLKNSSDFTNSKVMVVGGSYAGNLAAWMKVMYPNSVDAVLASSAPVLAKKDFYEYMETVTDTFRTYGSQECVDRISNKFNTFRELLQSPEGIKKLKKEQNICEGVDMMVPENQQLFFSEAMDKYAEKAQYRTPGHITDFCNSLDLNNYSLYNASSLRNDQLFCYNYNYYEVIREKFQGTIIYWFYQTCTEFGYYQSTTSSNQMFGDVLPIEFFYKTCSVLYGDQFGEQRVDQGVANTNAIYGGLTPDVENVVFVSGDMDPWHRLSILQDLSADVPAIYIKGSAHCHDLDGSTEEDNSSLKEARIRIKNLLKQWIGT